MLVSGNAVFRCGAVSCGTLETKLEAASTKHLGVTTDYFVRSAKEWQDVIAANPFPPKQRATRAASS